MTLVTATSSAMTTTPEATAASRAVALALVLDLPLSSSTSLSPSAASALPPAIPRAPDARSPPCSDHRDCREKGIAHMTNAVMMPGETLTYYLQADLIDGPDINVVPAANLSDVLAGDWSSVPQWDPRPCPTPSRAGTYWEAMGLKPLLNPRRPPS